MGRSILASALAIILVVAGLAACRSAVPTPSPSPTPTPTATPTPSPTPSPTASPTPSPTVDPNATPTPLPTGAPGAFYTVRNYEEALLAGNFAAAWALLGKGTQAKWGNLAAYTKDRTTFLATSGAAYQEELSPTNTLTLRQWIEGVAWGGSIDQVHAYLISVKWTAFTSQTSGWEIWVANPGKTGWLLYQAH
jgi:hypothetical protein